MIYEPAQESGAEPRDLAETAKILRLEPDVLRRIVESKKSVPLARVESEKEAEIIAAKLREKDWRIAIVSDETLKAEIPPIRLRGLEFDGEYLALVLFNTSEIRRVRGEDLVLIVAGSVFRRKTESLEKRKKGENEIIEASESASDDSLIDVYSREDARGYRISAMGFDFSALEDEKTIIAAENIKKIAAKLREFAPSARFDDDYRRIRAVLSGVWEVENIKDSQGLKRRGFGKLDLSNVEISSNLQQFTKYSRLQRETL